MAEIVKLAEEELSFLKEMNMEFNKSKSELGDIEISKYALIKRIEDLKVRFAQYESNLVIKYGENAVINLQTGEVTQKQN
jgi:hypothetical protein